MQRNSGSELHFPEPLLVPNLKVDDRSNLAIGDIAPVHLVNISGQGFQDFGSQTPNYTYDFYDDEGLQVQSQVLMDSLVLGSGLASDSQLKELESDGHICEGSRDDNRPPSESIKQNSLDTSDLSVTELYEGVFDVFTIDSVSTFSLTDWQQQLNQSLTVTRLEQNAETVNGCETWPLMSSTTRPGNSAYRTTLSRTLATSDPSERLDPQTTTTVSPSNGQSHQHHEEGGAHRGVGLLRTRLQFQGHSPGAEGAPDGSPREARGQNEEGSQTGENRSDERSGIAQESRASGESEGSRTEVHREPHEGSKIKGRHICSEEGKDEDFMTFGKFTDFTYQKARETNRPM